MDKGVHSIRPCLWGGVHNAERKKIMKSLLNAVMAVLFLLTGWAHAGTLQEDYQAMEARRQELENKRNGYEDQLKTLTSQQKSLTLIFYQCISQKDRDYWEAKLSEAQKTIEEMEAERLQIKEIRKRIDGIRQEMEKRRLEIENSHTNKGPGTPYETEFRVYMGNLEENYFKALENELFTAYIGILDRMEAYNLFLKESVSHCGKG
jgi:DNA repair exonuclease SbcCD ATPase subunit